MLTLLSPTGARPEAWRHCERAMLAQDFDGAVRWVIVDDGDVRQPVTFCRAGWDVEVIRPAHRWKVGRNTQAANMAAGLAAIPEDAVVVIVEDDDHYLPGHLSAMVRALAGAELVGQRTSYYYNVATRRQRAIPGHWHASLGASGVRGAALALLRDVCAQNSPRIDLDVWRGFKGRKALLEGCTAVGIKGLPGRGGIGVGHRADFGQPDPGGDVLRQWLGTQAAAYLG